MLSDHELVVAVRKLYPEVQKIEGEVLSLFNQRFIPGRGPTGLSGTDEVAFTIDYLRSAANMLERLNEGRSLRPDLEKAFAAVESHDIPVGTCGDGRTGLLIVDGKVVRAGSPGAYSSFGGPKGSDSPPGK